MPRLAEYELVAGRDVIRELELLGERLRGRKILHVNSTAVGGGVAEILNRMVPLLNELGIPTRWHVIKGGEAFFAATKKFHNALHGDPQEVTPRDYQVYEETVDANLREMSFEDDIVVIHDPQPAALVKARPRFSNHWIWRCHIDLSHAEPGVWGFFSPYVDEYDSCIVSSPSFAQKLDIPQIVIAPSIDPLSDKNRELGEDEVRRILERLGIPTDRPLVTQVSRFDRLKDPLGVIEAFQQAGASVKAKLLLVGGSATDDPEGAQVYREVLERAGGRDDVLVLMLPPTSHVEINAIQRASAIVIQKSLREGFGLTVAEALWKGRPVIASAVGGIPQQIIHRHSGILVHSIEGASYWIRRLLEQPDLARRLGENGREHVRSNFLLTRNLRDYLLIFLAVQNRGLDFIRL